MERPEGERKRRVWPLFALAVPLALVGAWVSCGEEERRTVAPLPTVGVAPDPVTVASAEPEDAGEGQVPDESPDAGPVWVDPDAGTAAEQVSRRWREALEPLFKSRQGKDPVSAKVISVTWPRLPPSGKIVSA